MFSGTISVTRRSRLLAVIVFVTIVFVKPIFAQNQDLEVARSLSELAEAHMSGNQMADAELLHKRALAIRERILGPDDVAVAGSAFNLARVYLKQGRLAEAEPLLKRAVAIEERALGPTSPFYS